jgi:hypothetical protein
MHPTISPDRVEALQSLFTRKASAPACRPICPPRSSRRTWPATGGCAARAAGAALGSAGGRTVYLCDRERPWGELNRLYPDLPKERWKGVVQVRRFPVDVCRDPDGFDGGPREVRGDNLALFGDPEMIETIPASPSTSTRMSTPRTLAKRNLNNNNLPQQPPHSPHSQPQQYPPQLSRGGWYTQRMRLC